MVGARPLAALCGCLLAGPRPGVPRLPLAAPASASPSTATVTAAWQRTIAAVQEFESLLATVRKEAAPDPSAQEGAGESPKEPTKEKCLHPAAATDRATPAAPQPSRRDHDGRS